MIALQLCVCVWGGGRGRVPADTTYRAALDVLDWTSQWGLGVRREGASELHVGRGGAGAV